MVGGAMCARSLRLVVAGAAPDTGNLGVSALCHATIAALAARLPDARLVVFDQRDGVGPATLQTANGLVAFERCGARHSRRLYRPEALRMIRLVARLGGLGNPAARRILRADAVLDISGGDSFTDLYGPRRFSRVVLIMKIVLECGVPLILLPQTYGPFSSDRARRIAASIVRRAAMAWARDYRSFCVLRELLGDVFDEDRHRCGVDVAFLLEARTPARPLPQPIRSWLALRRRSPVVGFNVSGLIFNDAVVAANRYGLRADYRQIVVGFLRQLLAKSDASVLLIPHVLTPPGHYESDCAACDTVLSALGPDNRSRVAVLPPIYDECEVKWVITQMDWFCGTRMHSTIAALSSGVPTAAIAYSVKTRGVFETCGQGRYVADPRMLDTKETVEHLWQAWLARDDARKSLIKNLPRVLEQAGRQMDEIVAFCRKSNEESPRAQAFA